MSWKGAMATLNQLASLFRDLEAIFSSNPSKMTKRAGTKIKSKAFNKMFK
jgi:hypothetical protein